MPAITAHPSSKTTRIIQLAHSGAGKTGALLSLAAAGYNLRILDFDNGCDILRELSTSQHPKFKPLYFDKGAHERIYYETLTEKYKIVNGNAVPLTARGWSKMVNLLSDWKGEGYSFGPVESWTERDILVMDSSTGAGKAALYHIQGMNGKLMSPPEGYEIQRMMGQAQALFESVIDMITSEAIKCNFILNAHINYQDEPGSVRKDRGEAIPQHGFVTVIGKASGPRVPRRFNNTVQIKSVGASKRIYTSTFESLDLKTAAPGRVKPDYPIETGLAELFRDLRGEG